MAQPKIAQHHVFEGERLGAFSDAVFAIVATIMVSYHADIIISCHGCILYSCV